MSLHTVTIVEDDQATRDNLVAAIRQHPELEMQAATGSCVAARNLLQQACPRVLLLDLGLPDGDGTDLIRAFARPGVCDAMVITVFADEQHVVTALEAGATGYLLKDSPMAFIGDSIYRLIQGESPISARIARYLVRRFQHDPEAEQIPAQKLTGREQQVLELIAKGFSYGEVATTLEISPNTVTSHIKHLYRKLAVRSRGEAVFEAASQGLIDLR